MDTEELLLDLDYQEAHVRIVPVMQFEEAVKKYVATGWEPKIFYMDDKYVYMRMWRLGIFD